MDPSSNTKTEDQTIALKKKRARRVSFVDNEITSVHIFKRDDEDSETPPHSKHSSGADENGAKDDALLGFFRDLGGDSDEEDLREASPSRNAGDDDDDGEVVNVKESFLRPIRSPSPGSSTAGSVATTDDEDDFRGPVSASFIRPGRLSDSAASDDNHDLTMDSTAFSLHYRSLAMSDSGDLKTPTRFDIPFGEKTPSQTSSPAALGSFMVLTKSKKQSSHSPVPANAPTASRDSNDMSIVGENPHRYDYDRLSPSLDAILAEGSKDLCAVSVLVPTASDSSNGSKESAFCQNKNGYLIAKGSADSAMSNTATHDMPIEGLSVAPSKLGEINRCSLSSPINQAINDFLSNKDDNSIADSSIHPIKSPNHPNKEIKEFVKDAAEPLQLQLDFAAANCGTPLKVDECHQLDESAQHKLGYHCTSEVLVKEVNSEYRGHVSDIDHNFDQIYEDPIQGSTPSSFAGRKQLFMGSPNSSRHAGTLTPSSKQAGSLLIKEYVKHGETLSSIRKSISKLKPLEPSPGTSSLKEGIDRLRSRLSKYSPGSPLFNGKDYESKHADTPNTPLGEKLFSATLQNKGHPDLISMDDHGNTPLRHIGKLSQYEEDVNNEKRGEYFHCKSADPKPVGMLVSPYQVTGSTRKVIHLDQADSTLENENDGSAIIAHDQCVSSPQKILDQRLSPSIEYQGNCCGELNPLDQQNASVISGLGHLSECDSQAVAEKLDLSFSGKSGKSSSPSEVTQIDNLSQSVSERKPAESPGRRVQALSTYREDVIQSPIQQASTMLPSMQEPPGESLYHNMQNLSPKGISDAYTPADNNFHQALQVAESSFTKSGIETYSQKKRKGIELLRDGNNKNKVRKTSISPEINERGKLGDQTWKNWTDILIQFSGITKQLFSPSVDKLNLNVICMLEDILVHLQKVKKYEILCSEVHSQKNTDPLSSLRHRRVMEAKMLLYNIAYKKAKLQLMHMKRERLLRQVQQLSSGLQESKMLKLKLSSSKHGVTHTKANDSHLGSGLLNSESKYQVPFDKVTAMRQELEALDGKTKSLKKYFHTYCKMQGDPSSAVTITLVRDYLKKRMSCKCIFKDLQLWELDDFELKDGCYRLLLNYSGFINQRFTINAGAPSLTISSKLNNQNIIKTFLGMDACAAFVFVLNPDITKKCTGLRCLALETQITSSLLSNLLDVVEEVQLARIEIRNLIQAKFSSQSVGQLNLHLSFIDFNSGRKVNMNLDMTCLKCGVYPMEILPSHIHDPASGVQKSLPSPLVAEITSAAESVRVGYSRIIRLCRSISQAIQTFTESR